MDYDELKYQCKEVHSLDQKLALAREYYMGLPIEKRQRFRKYLKKISRLLPDPDKDIEAFAEQMGKMVHCGDRLFSLRIHVEFFETGDEADIDPLTLYKALKAWDRGESYPHPYQWYEI